MKTKKDRKTVIDEIRYHRESINRAVREHLFSRMVADSLRHLVLPPFKIKAGQNLEIIPYNPKFQPTADVWDAQVARIAKWFRKNPHVHISKDHMSAQFTASLYKYPKNDRWNPRWNAYIWVTIHSKNTESCEVEMVKVESEEPRLTGYCKALSEKQYVA